MGKKNLFKALFLTIILSNIAMANHSGERILKASQKYGMSDPELRYLIKNTNPNLTLVDKNLGATALIHSSIKNRPNMVRMLLSEGGVKINAVDKNGESSLIWAAKKCNPEVIEILLDFKADKNVKGNAGKTALVYAREKCSANIVGLIIRPRERMTPTKKKVISDLVKIKGILVYMDKYKRAEPEKKEENFDKMAKVVGVWPAIDKKKKERAQEEEKMRKRIQGSKTRAMAKLRAMGLLKKGGADHRKRLEEKNKIDEEMKKKQLAVISKFKKEKKADVNQGMDHRIRTIKLIIGEKLLKNQTEKALIEKKEAIKELLDVTESKEVRMAKLRMARKKSLTINQFNKSGKILRERINKIKIEEAKALEIAAREAKLKEELERKRAEEILKLEKLKLEKKMAKKIPLGATELIKASIDNQPKKVELLLDEGDSDIDEVDGNGETALMGAAKYCNTQVIETLLEFGADKTIKGKAGKTALNYARKNCSVNIAKKIGGAPRKRSPSFKSVALIAKRKSKEKVITELSKVKGILNNLKKEGPVKKKKSFERMAQIVGVWPAIHKKNKERAQEEEKRKKEMRERIQGSKARAMAKLRAMGRLKKGGTQYRRQIEEKNKLDAQMEKKQLAVIANFKKRKDIDVKNGMDRRSSIINLIINAGSGGNKNVSALKNQTEETLIKKRDAIKELLDIAESKEERTARIRSAREKAMAINRFKKSGKHLRARIKKIEIKEAKALERATREAKLRKERERKKAEEKLKLEKLKLEKKMAKNIPPGATQLIKASIDNQPKKIEFLLDEGDSDVDEVDANGETALIWAAKHCHHKVIAILLEFGANKTTKGKAGKTAWDYAHQLCPVKVSAPLKW